MIDRVLVLSLAGSTLFGALLLLEWDSGQPSAEEPGRDRVTATRRDDAAPHSKSAGR